MSNIKPVSDLRNYNDVLKACQIWPPIDQNKAMKSLMISWLCFGQVFMLPMIIAWKL